MTPINAFLSPCRHKFPFLLLCLFFSTALLAKQPYVLYNAKGKKSSFRKMIKSLKDKEIILFGESHNNPIAHWLEIETTKALYSPNLVLGAEMFEADNQHVLNDYLSSTIDAEGLDTNARLWSNYKTDYAPLLNFAKEHNVLFIATNIPRVYATKVYKGGFESLHADSLSEEERSWMAPMPIPFDPFLPRYQNILTMMGDHGTPELVKAQAIKDATMAHFILKNFSLGKQFLHFNGCYHSDYYEGILWYLQKEHQEYDYATVSTVVQNDISQLNKEFLGKADFIICIDEDVTTSY